MELFRLEHKKLWRKTSVRVAALLCFVYIVVFAGALSYQWFDMGSSGDVTSAFGNHFDGYGEIRASQAQAERYGGLLTDESLRRMVQDIQSFDAGGREDELERSERTLIDGWLSQLYPELEEQDRGLYSVLMAYYVDAGALSDLYGRRQAMLEDFLHTQGQWTGPDGELLRGMNDRVQTPFRYRWTEGWHSLLAEKLPAMGTVLALFLAIILAPTFSGEWRNNTAPLLLTMDRGWRRLARAKVLSGLAFTLELFALVAAGNVAAQLIWLGTDGWDMPVQLVKLLAVAPWNMLQAEVYEYAFTLLGAVGFAGVVMLLSALVKSNVLALLLSLAAAYGPMAVSGYAPQWAQKALELLPLTGSAADVFRTNTFHILGRAVWSPWLLIAVPVLIGLVCLPFAVMRWSRREKA